MSEQLVNHVFDDIVDVATKNNNDRIICQLHGGEPLVYKDLQLVIDNVKRTQQCSNVMWSVTTNLVYKLKPVHYQLFDLMNAFGDQTRFIQTSWDYSIRFENDKQLQLWEHNVKTLIDRGIVVQPTVCVTNLLINDITPKQLIDYIRSLGCNSVNFERITDTGRAVDNHLRPYNCDLDRWLFDAFCYSQSIPNFTVPLFEGVVQSVKGELLGCRARRCMSTVTTYNPDGTVGGCPNTMNSPYGTIDKIDNIKKVIWIEKEQTYNPICYTCEYFRYCNGDCFQLSWDNTGCPGMKSIYDYLFNQGNCNV